MKGRPGSTRDLRWSRALAALAIAAAASGVPLSQTSALCAAPPPLAEHIEGADMVFVGVATEVGNRGRTAVFAVAEQWKGDPLGPQVVVHGGEDDPNAASTSDRTYEAGVRYLVAAYVRGARLEDNFCSATQIWDADLAHLRPADARMLADLSSDRQTPKPTIPRELLVIGGVSALLALVAGLAFVRRPRERRGGRG